MFLLFFPFVVMLIPICLVCLLNGLNRSSFVVRSWILDLGAFL